MANLYVLLLAVAVDLAFGEPPPALHPVVWMGQTITLMTGRITPRRPALQFAWGALVTLAVIALFTVPVYFLLVYLQGLHTAAYIIAAALLLKSSFSVRELRRAALRIKTLLATDKLAEARWELRALVSRNTSDLDTGQVVSATVESVAENSCDSLVAPLFYFLLLGVPGAVAYRVVNTLDAMIGYHGKWEYTGKFAARVDDVLNYLPARLTALILVLAAAMMRQNPRGAWTVMLRDHRKTESPNAGWTMSALAGALGVQIEKVGHYRLGDSQQALAAGSIEVTLRLMLLVAVTWVVLSMLIEVIRFAA